MANDLLNKDKRTKQSRQLFVHDVGIPINVQKENHKAPKKKQSKPRLE